MEIVSQVALAMQTVLTETGIAKPDPPITRCKSTYGICRIRRETAHALFPVPHKCLHWGPHETHTCSYCPTYWADKRHF